MENPARPRHRPDDRVRPGRMAGLAAARAGRISRDMPLDATDVEMLDPFSDAVSRAFERVGPAVAGVQAARADGRPMGQGSGVLYTPDGYLLTNSHVVGRAERLTVSLATGRNLPATIVGDDPATDLAVLRVAGDGFEHAQFGSSSRLRVGQLVIAIGNPLGFQSTVTTGMISALNRDEGFTEFDDYIQTDAAINQGNSGGPLFNHKGEVIAVNSALQTSSTGDSNGNIGIGLTIPINDAKFVVLERNPIMWSRIRRPRSSSRIRAV